LERTVSILILPRLERALASEGFSGKVLLGRAY